MPETRARAPFARRLVTQFLALTLLCQPLAVPSQTAGAPRATGPQSARPSALPNFGDAEDSFKTKGTGGARPKEPSPVGASQAASCPAATARPAPARLTYTGQVSASCGEPLPVSARLTDECGNPLAGRRLDFNAGTLSASAATDGPFNVRIMRYDPVERIISAGTLFGHPLRGWRYWRVLLAR